VAPGEIDGGAIYRRSVQENWRGVWDTLLQCQEEVFGDIWPVREERADLVSGTTRAKDSIAGEGAVLDETERGSLRLVDPAVEKLFARVGKEVFIVTYYLAEWQLG
jgi:hypothetical protein